MEQVKIKTGRLLMKALTLEDARDLYDFRIRNAEFFKQWSPLYHKDYFNIEYHKNNLVQIENDMLKGSLVQFGVYKTENDEKMIGSVVFSNIVLGPFRSCFLGYRVDKDEINNGYASEAIKAACGYMFKERKLHRIEANIIPRNTASIKAIEKAGFTYEGISKKYLNINGVWEDHLHYVLLNEEIE
ncbi:MAG TPA: GNAT family protein [Ignavibacteria bacterium]|nr:GNAT family protein [Ignavibacteria bacterium]